MDASLSRHTPLNMLTIKCFANIHIKISNNLIVVILLKKIIISISTVISVYSAVKNKFKVFQGIWIYILPPLIMTSHPCTGLMSLCLWIIVGRRIFTIFILKGDIRSRQFLPPIREEGKVRSHRRVYVTNSQKVMKMIGSFTKSHENDWLMY